MATVLEILGNIRPEFDFNTSSDFINDGILDSFDIVCLVDDLDEQFSISIDGTEIIPENFKNIESIKALMNRHGVTL